MSLTFSAPLTASLVPSTAAGSPLPTFTRASRASLFDNTGTLRYALAGEARFMGARRVQNLVAGKSEDFTAAAWTKSGVVVSPATTLQATITNGTCLQSYTGTGDFVFTVTLTRVQGTGAIALTIDGTTWTTVPVTPVTTAYSIQQAGVVNPQFGIRIAVSGEKVIATRAQLERGGTASEYVSVGVTAAPFHGAGVDAVKYFVTDAAGAPIPDTTLRGFVHENATTNRCLWSQDFLQTKWVKVGINVAVDNTIAPDGTQTADLLTAVAANGTCIQDMGTVANARKFGTLFVKRATGSGPVQFTLDGGAGWWNVPVTASWRRVELSQATADEDFGLRIVTSGDAIHVWGAQVETQPYDSTSHVPTAGVPVSRALDRLCYAFAGNANAAEGTIYCEAQKVDSAWAAGEVLIAFHEDAGYAPASGYRIRADQFAMTAGGFSASTPPLDITPQAWNAAMHVIAATYHVASKKGQAFADGATSAFDTAMDFTGVGTTKVQVGMYEDVNNAYPLVGTIRHVNIWSTVQAPDPGPSGGGHFGGGGRGVVWRRHGLRAR